MNDHIYENGSITVFLSLIFVIVFSLVMTSLEAAKSAAARSFAGMLLVCAAESEAAQFYRPLFEEYHLFAIDTGFGGPAGDISKVASEIESRIPSNIWKIENDGCTLSAYEMIADGTGSIFTEQAVKYEVIKKAGDLLHGLAEKLGIVGSQGKTAKVLKKKLEAEEKIAKIEEHTLELMKLVDGVKCNISGNGEALYSTEPGFLKRFLNVQASMYSAQINNKDIYAALSGKYVNPAARLEELRLLVVKYAQALEEEERSMADLEKLKDQKKIKETELYLSRDALAAINAVIEARIAALWIKAGLSDTDSEAEGGESAEEIFAAEAEKIRQEYKDEIILCETGITRLELEIGEIEAKISEEEQKLEKYRAATSEKNNAVAQKAGPLLELFVETASYVRESLNCIMKIRTAQSEAEPEVDEYGLSIEEAGEDIGTEILEDHEKSYGLMKEYLGKRSAESVFDIERAESSLRRDMQFLEECGYEALLTFSGMDSKAAYERAEALKVLESRTGEFVYDGLVFDYSSFTADSGASETGMADELTRELGDGFLSFILKNTEDLSKEELSAALLPSRIDSVTESDPENDAGAMPATLENTSGAAAMADSIGASDMDEISVISGEMSAEEDISDAQYADLSGAIRSLGLVMYCADSFGCYTDQALTDDTVMKYEREYIIGGKLPDKDNLTSVLLRIFLLRLVTSGIHVFSDRDLGSRAELLAAAAVGFTGMPFLVSLAKYLILFVCAIEQALIETAVLVRGRKTAVITGKEGFMADIADIAAFSPDFIQRQADAYPEIKGGIGYEDYLGILMLLNGQKKTVYRAMDLIQENLRYEYNEDFLMINSLSGFSVNASFNVPGQFINFGGYRISSEYELRY